MSPTRRSVLTLLAVVVATAVAVGPMSGASTTEGATPAAVPVPVQMHEVEQHTVNSDGSITVSMALATEAGPRSIDSACTGRWAHPFLDISTSPHAVAIACLVGLDVANGVGPATFAPSNGVTRAQMASFLARALDVSGAELPGHAPDLFADDDGSVHEASINRLAAIGVVNGTGRGTYSPGAPVTRAQLAAFVIRAIELTSTHALPAAELRFDDVKGHALAQHVAKAADNGIVAGTGAGRYQPNGLVTRAQMASFLERTLDLLVVNGAVLPPAPGSTSTPATPPAQPTPTSTVPPAPTTTTTAPPAPTTTAPPAPTTTAPPAPPTAPPAPAAPRYDADHAFMFEPGEYGAVAPARWDPCRPITYRIDPAGATSAQLMAVGAALADVSSATGIVLQPSTGPASLNISFVPGTDSRVAGSVVGRANVTAQHGARNLWLTTAEVVFDRDDLARTAATNGAGFTWGSVARHELGHVMGLAHASTTAQVMYPSMSSKSPTPWGPGDRYGLYALGAAQGCR